MADLSKVRLNGTIYNFKDAEARLLIETLPDATTVTSGLMSAKDKETLDNLNPNISVTLSNLFVPEVHIINAKRENLLDLEIIESVHISEQIRTSNLLNVNDTFGNYYIGSNGNINSSAPDLLGDFIPVTPGQVIYYTGHVGETTASSVNRRLHVYTSNKTWIRQLNAHTNLKVGQNWSTYGTIPSNGAYIRVSWGTTDTNVMISVGAPTKYEPYYITPFSPVTSASFQIASNAEYTDAITYTITLPAAAGSLYGFRYNPILGKIYATTGHIASYNGETLPGGWISDRDIYEEGGLPSIGAEVVYNLDETDIVEYDITPINIPLFYHINYFLTESGVIKSLTYYAETLMVEHLTIGSGITFGEEDIFEEDINKWNYTADNIDLKANIHSPALTGAPLSTTPTITTNNDRIATTAYTNNMFSSIVTPGEANNKASKNYSVDEFLIFQGKLYKVTAAIAQGATLTPGTNIAVTDIVTELNLLRSLIS